MQPAQRVCRAERIQELQAESHKICSSCELLYLDYFFASLFYGNRCLSA